MRFALKDYQVAAVAEVLANLRDAKDDVHTKRRKVAFSLTATTGAGKTVMAAAVIEALFDGNDEFDFEADKSATVLWFTDDPSLNEQTRFRLMEASDPPPPSRFVVIENTFNQPKFEQGKVYFLNAQKLSKNSLLVKGAPDDGQEVFQQIALRPDLRTHTIWDTIGNTIEDRELTLYVILDEAHRGMRRSSKADVEAKQTIVRRLVNGSNGVPAIPVVWGISATVERFNAAMKEATGRTTYAPIVVDPALVQASGLLKDDIRLDIPSEAGRFDTVLLSRATRKIIESTHLWKQYAMTQEPIVDPVVPLMVIQSPNTPTEKMLLNAITTIQDEWPDLGADGVAHVFGEHTTLKIGPYQVPYIKPEQVQDAIHVRVLLAKDAISTGWDCPRAEVLMSFRPARDQTHITQLLGRMVRAPLARRVPGNDRLNAVECVLPFFDTKTARLVAEILLGQKPEGDDGTGGTGGGTGRRVLIDAKDMLPNPSVPEPVWEKLETLPSQSLPKRLAKPIKRLTALAQALSNDNLRANAGKDAHKHLFSVLDGQMAQHKTLVNKFVEDILTVEGETVVAAMRTKQMESVDFTEVADDRVIEDAFRAAGRAFSPDVTRKYADHLAGEAMDIDVALRDAHARIAALAMVEQAKVNVEREADELARQWLNDYRVDIKGLNDDRQAVYNDIHAQSTSPQRIAITRPKVRIEETRRDDGSLVDTRPKHLLADEGGNFPTGGFNTWETRVVDSELKRAGVAAWYRNPGRASQDSLAVAYKDGQGKWRQMFPDFVFFEQVSDGGVKASIVDPHGIHLSDAIPKLRGLAHFADMYGDEFHRIESIAEMKDGTLRVLDLTKETVRAAIGNADSAEALYRSTHAADY